MESYKALTKEKRIGQISEKIFVYITKYKNSVEDKVHKKL